VFQMSLFALCCIWSYVVFGFVWYWIPAIGSWGRTLGIELIALSVTYAASWTYAILYGLRRQQA